MRSWILPSILGVAILLLIFAIPFFWQWNYQARLLHAVGIGATREEYKKALATGTLGPGFLRPAMTYSRPINFHGMVYTIWAFPRWNLSGRLIGYGMYTELACRGYTKWWNRPDSRELDAEFY